jgi:hypothetical protein
MADNMDTLLASIEDKKKLFDDAVAECREDLRVGKTGLNAYLKAEKLQAELAELIAQAGAEIDEALKLLGGEQK